MAEKPYKPSGKVEDFLIAEYAHVSQDYRRLRDESIRRLNFFVSLTSGFVAGLFVLFELSSIFEFWFVQWIAIIAFSFLAMLGWYTLEYLISRDYSTDFNMRAMNRIRKYFTQVYPEISEHLLWSTSEEPSHYLDRNDVPSVILIMISTISLLIAFDIGLIINVFLDAINLAVLAGVLGFGITFVILRQHAKEEYKKNFEKAKTKEN